MPQNIMESPNTSTLKMSDTPGENHADGENKPIGFNCKGNYKSTADSITRNDSSTILPAIEGSSILDTDHIIKKSETELRDASISLSIKNPCSITTNDNPTLTSSNKINNDLKGENMDFSQLEDAALEDKKDKLNADVLSDNNSIPSDEKNSSAMEVDEPAKEDGESVVENHSDVDEILDKISKEDELGKMAKKEGSDKEGHNEGGVDEYEEEYYEEEGAEGEYYDEEFEEGAEGEYLEGGVEKGTGGDEVGQEALGNGGKKDSEKLAVEDDLEKVPAEKDTGKVPAEKDTGKVPAEKDTGKVPAEKDTGKVPAEKDTGKVPAEKDTGKVPAEKDTGKVPAEKDTGKVPAEKKDTGKVPAEKDTGNVPAEKDTGNVPAEKDTGNVPAEKDTGNVPAEKDTGNVPAEKDTGNVPAEKDTGNVPAEKDTGNVPAEKDTGKVPAEKDTGKVPAEKDTGKVPAEKKETGKVPAEKKDTGKVPAEKDTGKVPAEKDTENVPAEKDPGKGAAEDLEKGAGEDLAKVAKKAFEKGSEVLKTKGDDNALGKETEKLADDVLDKETGKDLEIGEKDSSKSAEDDLEDEAHEGAEDDILDEAAENELLGDGVDEADLDDECVEKIAASERLEKAMEDETLKKTQLDEELSVKKELEITVVGESLGNCSEEPREDQMDIDGDEKQSMLDITDVSSQAEEMETSTQYDKIEDVSNDAEMPDLSKTKESKNTTNDQEMEESFDILKNEALQRDQEAPELEINEAVKNDEVVLEDSDDDFDPISLLAVEHSTPDEPVDSDFHNNMGISIDDESRPSSATKTPVNDQDQQSEISEITPNDSDAEEDSQDFIKVKEFDKDIDRVVKKKLEEILTKTACQADGIPEHFLFSTNRRKKLGLVKEGTVEEVMDKLVSKVSSHAKKLCKESSKLKLNDQKQSQDKDENNQNWDNQDNQKGFKNCTECGSNKGLRYQVLFHGRTCFLCSDHCFQVFRSKQNLAPPPPGLAPRPAENCSVCRVEIKNGQGYFPLDTDGKSVCSEECIRQYQQMHGAKQTCAQCKKGIEGRTKCLSWETMEFCNEDCLGKYQQFLGSYCACCKQAVQRLSLGKYCVRFGSDIRQFCSGKCLEEFKRGLKVCTFCQKDLTGCTDGFLAPVGNKGLFKDFCSQQCLSQYETMNSAAGAAPKTKKCSVCQKVAPVKAQVTFNNQEHTLCSDPCVAAFRYANKITNKICDTCHKFFKSESSPLQFEGASKRFCTKTCMNLFVLSHRKIVPCTWCKVKKYNFDMIERVDSNNHVQLFCSLNCLSLFRVSLNATSSRSIRCDHCRNNLPAQYHLTMSDASIRNFCTYQCVIQFQSQFTSVPTLTTVTPTVRNQPVASAVKNVSTAPAIAPAMSKPVALSNATPVISSVISLAPTNMGAVRPTQATMANVNSISTAVGTNFMPQNAQVNFAPYINKVQSVQTASPTVPPQPQQVQVIRELVVKPSMAKITKNKMISCKPSMQTKGVACKPHPCHKCTQTDELEPPPPTYIPIPIPVPVFVPVPMHMYTRTVPCPTPFPIPIPVPVFLPTTKNNTEQILHTLKEIRERTPDNPFEAELLMMAEMVASQDQPEERQIQNNVMPSLDACNNDYDGLASMSLGGSSGENSLAHEYVEFTEPMLDLETALATPSFDPPSLIAEDPQVFLSSLGDESSSDLTPREQRMRQRNSNSSKRRNSGRGRSRGRKRSRLSESAQGSEDSNEPYISGTDTSFSEPIQRNATVMGDGSQAPDANLCLKYMFGVNAWKHWVIQKNNQLERGSQSRRLKLFKPDLLQLSADELNYSLCLFVKEVRKPNGEEYAPDSIYYLCLGIQMYIFENGRVDNIFTDGYYEKFTECLNDVVQKQEMAIMREGRYISRIEEEILWESKQLGAHSPHVLLNTLMYFNTKHFGLRNVDDHANLSFSHIIKHYKKDLTPPQGTKVLPAAPGKLAILKYYPPAKELKLRKKEEIVYEQIENLNNVLRCPVKLYEFYLSKCPDSIRTRSDVFYLYPERSCVPDSPVWYSMQPLGRETLSKMLHRIRLVREINRPNLCD